MSGRWMVAGLAAAVALTYGIGDVAGQQHHPARTPTVIHDYEADFKEVASGVATAVLWRNRHKGAYGAFTRFEPASDSGVHAHVNDTWIVVIQGTYVYNDESGERRIEKGEALRIPGGKRHRRGGDSQWGVLFYEEASPSGSTHAAGAAHSQQSSAPVVVSMDEAAFKEVALGASRAVLWGDHEKGPYGAFTEFEPEFATGPRIHTHDVWMVVIQGFYLYKDDAGEKRLGPGDFMRIPGGTRHRATGDKKWGAVFYEASDGRFDWTPAQ